MGTLYPTVQGSGPYEAGLVKYNPDGSLDASFGKNGVVIGPQIDTWARAAQYPPTDTTGNAGKIVVSGVGGPNGGFGQPFSIARLNPDGSLDTSFGSNGIATVHVGNTIQGEGFVNVVIQPDGKVLALGYSMGYDSFVLARFNANGTLDTTFGQGGWTSSQGTILEASHRLLQPNGRVIVTAGNFTVTARNADGSTNTGYTGTVHFTSSDPQAVLAADYTFTTADQGVHNFSATLKTAGTQSLTATDTATGSINGGAAGIVVTPAALSTFRISAPSSVTHGVAFSITVTALDAYGNGVTGYTGTVHFSSSDGRAILPANYTFTASDAGVHTFVNKTKLRTRGAQTLYVFDSLTNDDGSVNINVT